MRAALSVALCGAVSYGGAALAVEGGSQQPVLRENLEAGVYRLEGTFSVGVDAHAIWEVLTDFGDMPKFVSSIRSSVPRVLPDGGLLVAQEFEGKAFIFSRTLRVQLEVEEQPEQGIAFRDVAHRDFDSYAGSWEIRAVPAPAQVTYRLNAKPHDSLPDFLGEGAFKDGVTRMLVALRDEMVRRGQQLHPHAMEGGIR